MLHRSQIAVPEALDQLQERLPFPLLGIDSDNDGLFINELMLKYCQKNSITFTRCRPYKKNDQCFVEQTNWPIVRRAIGYQRYESQTSLQRVLDTKLLSTDNTSLWQVACRDANPAELCRRIDRKARQLVKLGK
ncbi:MAG: transposase family protein [Chloroflexi bacterium]|nr:transposase family protein [Chloroflexota bacterium]